MKVERILTSRRYLREHYWQIVWEWEDQLVRDLQVPLCHNLVCSRLLHILWQRVLRRSLSSFPMTHDAMLAFVMRPDYWDANLAGKETVIPVIIDFWFREKSEFHDFEARYADNPVTLITSREVFEKVRSECPMLRVLHWPVSLPDKWIAAEFAFEKKWDCVVVGRPNLVLNSWLDRYSKEHPDFTYVYNRRTASVSCDYFSSRGEHIGNAFKSRESYFNLLRASRVGLYSTPSMDDSRMQFKGVASNGYNQVTPRFLEYIASGCHVIARYNDNPDTKYFEMNRLASHTTTYEDFARKMDFARTHIVDNRLYAAYLKKHSTSSRVELLNKMLQEI